MEESIFQEVELGRIGRCPWQPRREFAGPEFDEMVASVEKQGVLQPVLLRPVNPYEETFAGFPTARQMVDLQLVAGERRFRALWAASEKKGPMVAGCRIPAIVRPLSDDEAFDIMTIENLHRQDLNELEEAFNFNAYLDRHGNTDKAARALADRIGKSARYIRRRVRLLKLPAEVLGAWSQGKIGYGYLEQLVRIAENPEQVQAYFRAILEEGWQFQTVKELKAVIDRQAPKLSTALWKVKKTCAACPSNSTVQAEQVGDESFEKGAHCLDAKCFKAHQQEYLTEHWADSPYHQAHGTSGVVFREDCPWNKCNQFYGSMKPGKKCRAACPSFVTVLMFDGTVSQGQVCIGKKSCFDEQTKSKTGKAGQSLHSGPSRGFWQREHQVDTWVKEKVKPLVAGLDESDARFKRLRLLARLTEYSGPQVHRTFHTEFKNLFPSDFEVDNEEYLLLDDDELWSVCLQVPEDQLDRAAAGTERLGIEAALAREYGVETCALLGVDLLAEWRLTKEYLDQMEASEIQALAKEHQLWQRPEPQRFLYETLLKKRGAFKSCTKEELIRVILESGMDLAGVVPKEVREALGKEE